MKKYITLFFSILIFAISCASESKSSDSSYHEDTATPESTEANYDADQPRKLTSKKEIATPDQTRKLIKNANYRFQVEDVGKSSANILSIVKDFSGYITSMNEATTNYNRSNNISIRVANDQFEKLLDTISKEAIHVDYRKLNARDVTEEFVDLNLRLKTKKEVHKKYVELLRNKAKNVEEILFAENEIRKLTEEIEAKEGRLRFLTNQVSMSTVHLEIYQKVEYKAELEGYEITFVDRFKKGFLNGWEMVISVILSVVYIWPIMILLGLLIWKRKRIFSFRRKEIE